MPRVISYKGSTKSSKLHPEGVEKNKIVFLNLFFNIVPLNINALSLTTLKYCNPILEEDGILVHQESVHSTY